MFTLHSLWTSQSCVMIYISHVGQCKRAINHCAIGLSDEYILEKMYFLSAV